MTASKTGCDSVSCAEPGVSWCLQPPAGLEAGNFPLGRGIPIWQSRFWEKGNVAPFLPAERSVGVKLYSSPLPFFIQGFKDVIARSHLQLSFAFLGCSARGSKRWSWRWRRWRRWWWRWGIREIWRWRGRKRRYDNGLDPYCGHLDHLGLYAVVRTLQIHPLPNLLWPRCNYSCKGGTTRLFHIFTNHHQASITTSSLVTFVASGSLSRNGSQEGTGKVVSKGEPLGFLEIFLCFDPKKCETFWKYSLTQPFTLAGTSRWWRSTHWGGTWPPNAQSARAAWECGQGLDTCTIIYEVTFRRIFYWRSIIEIDFWNYI